MKQLSNKEIVELLKEAKILYIIYAKSDIYYRVIRGLCYCITKSYKKKYNKYLYYDEIIYIIPKFTKEFCNAEPNMDVYWWKPYDAESRIKAFDKLIFYYKYKAPVYDIINKIKSIFK